MQAAAVVSTLKQCTEVKPPKVRNKNVILQNRVTFVQQQKLEENKNNDLDGFRGSQRVSALSQS